MSRNFSLHTRIARPVSKVFEAVIDKDQLAHYFVHTSTGHLVEGARVTWTWIDEPGSASVTVTKIVPNKRIEMTLDPKDWGDTQHSYEILVVMEFEELDKDSTMLTISEQGWQDDPDSIKGSYGHCWGWEKAALGLKAYLMHGIDLRK